jgi:hypothetical protein
LVLLAALVVLAEEVVRVVLKVQGALVVLAEEVVRAEVQQGVLVARLVHRGEAVGVLMVLLGALVVQVMVVQVRPGPVLFVLAV